MISQITISRISMNKKSSIKKRKPPCSEEAMAKSVCSAHVKFDFDSQTLARVLVALDHFAAADPVHEDQCVSIKMTKNPDNAIRFSLTDIENIVFKEKKKKIMTLIPESF